VSSTPLAIVCAWCERVRTGAGRWEQGPANDGAAEATHGICPDCLAEQERAASADACVPAPLIPVGARS
jgi:hypothetical protein